MLAVVLIRNTLLTVPDPSAIDPNFPHPLPSDFGLLSLLPVIQTAWLPPDTYNSWQSREMQQAPAILPGEH